MLHHKGKPLSTFADAQTSDISFKKKYTVCPKSRFMDIALSCKETVLSWQPSTGRKWQ